MRSTWVTQLDYIVIGQPGLQCARVTFQAKESEVRPRKSWKAYELRWDRVRVVLL